MRVNYISSKDTGETLTIYVWGDNTNIMWGMTKMILLEVFLGLFYIIIKKS